MFSINHKRKEAMYFQCLSQIIGEEVKNANVHNPTVTAVKLSPSKSLLYVYLSFYSYPQKSLKNLNNLKKFIRFRLAQLRNQRKLPQLEFKLDDSLDRVNKIEKILNNLKKKS